ncbi:Cytochrome b-c1 complex subunit 1, mitochondrial [Myotis davidii]|uniref:Cytochrome b-c1 complex subunit 1, mitochondrial n=1 Tax=Myotis davidii TaxID=225400 RepID=L5LFP3_MYODS|nr:Cytochrome b-c1 complex subunit 1, mitochondrial [Myotis davidii]
MSVRIPPPSPGGSLEGCLAPQQVSTEHELAEPAASGQEGAQAPDGCTLKSLGLPPPAFHSLVLDLGALSFVDTVCIKSLKNAWSRPLWYQVGLDLQPWGCQPSSLDGCGVSLGCPGQWLGLGMNPIYSVTGVMLTSAMMLMVGRKLLQVPAHTPGLSKRRTPISDHALLVTVLHMLDALLAQIQSHLQHLAAQQPRQIKGTPTPCGTATFAQALQRVPETQVSQLDNGLRVASEQTSQPTCTVGVWIDVGSRYENEKNNGAGYFVEHLAFKAPESETLRSHRGRSTPRPGLACVSRRVEHRQLLDLAQKHFSGISGTYAEDAVPTLAPCRFTGSQISHRDDALPLAHVAIAVEGPGWANPDNVALQVANAMIGHYDCTYGGGVHLSSPLASVAVANKLCQSFQAFNICYAETGLLGAHFVCDRMSIDDMVFFLQGQWWWQGYLTQGTKNRPGNALEKEVESMGAHLSAYTTREHTAYYIKALSQDLPKAVELLADVVQNCSLEDSQIEKERDVILRELQESDASLRDVAFDYLHATAFQGTPLAQPVEGPSDNVRKLSRADLTEFLGQHYKAPRMVLAAAGVRVPASLQEVDAQTVREVCSKYFYDQCPAVAAVGPTEQLPDYNRTRSGMFWLRF